MFGGTNPESAVEPSRRNQDIWSQYYYYYYYIYAQVMQLFQMFFRTPGVQFAQFVLRINRVRVMSARFNSTVNQTGNLTTLRPLPAISNEPSSDFYWNFTLRLLQMATSCCNASRSRHIGARRYNQKETRPNNYVRASAIFNCPSSLDVCGKLAIFHS